MTLIQKYDSEMNPLDKSLAKSKRRHGLKMIDRKWAPRIAAGKKMASTMNEALKRIKNK
jgi:hypothetical protein